VADELGQIILLGQALGTVELQPQDLHLARDLRQRAGLGAAGRQLRLEHRDLLLKRRLAPRDRAVAQQQEGGPEQDHRPAQPPLQPAAPLDLVLQRQHRPASCSSLAYRAPLGALSAQCFTDTVGEFRSIENVISNLRIRCPSSAKSVDSRIATLLKNGTSPSLP